MFEFKAIKAFFETDLGKSLIVGALTIAVLFGTYKAGELHGSKGQYEVGFKAGVASKANEITELKEKITGLVGTIKATEEARSNKKDEVEQSTADAYIEGQKSQQAKIQQRDEIIRKFADFTKSQPTPQAAPKGSVCSVGKDTVEALNELLETQIIYEASKR